MGTIANTDVKTARSASEKRNWIYAKKPVGKLYNYRQWVGYILLLFLFSAPFFKINGNPFLMFNIIERRFSIFGNLFYPQDLYIFVFGMLILMVCVVLFTVVYGRVWCGWTCPQTIFMELIFRRIEYWIEGDWKQQKKLDEGPDSDLKAWKKLAKHSIFFAISFLISNVFLAYIIGVDSLYRIIVDPIEAHYLGFISILIFTGLFYAVFAHVREIVCTTICPYGRLQSVLLDEQTVTVAYDVHRGEPRGKKKREDDNKGDCIDCKLCVHVCPTGIDIRNGIQMECVSCTACIDACDAVMDKIGKPTRLIGFYAMGEVEDKPTFKRSNGRAIAYSIVLFALITVFCVMIFNRPLLDGRVLRAKGSSYQQREDGYISNLYTLELMNKSGKVIQFTLKPEDDETRIEMVNPIKELKKDGSAMLSFFLLQRKETIKSYKQDVKVDIVVDGEVIEKMKTTFIGSVSSK
ncbi:cytochrome c oxidase accessory protein CcoG [Sphingobacterium sp. LRF_L2]|uniref:cytochrome c oxidase accessory protein CcoG n=1 Tax=Sphingobacterium sp. LRF_L2 TaxID=3369421 RepID=UPI003F5FCFBA